MSDPLVSTIIRIHPGANFKYLQEAIRSVAQQNYSPIELIVVAQGTDSSFIKKIEQIANLEKRIRIKVLAVSAPEGKDSRSLLINEGIRVSTGRFLSFLDFDDILYPDAYQKLVTQAIQTDAAITVAGARLAVYRRFFGFEFCFAREPFLKRPKSQIDLIGDNYFPIHSYLINKDKIPPEELRFNTEFSRLEDYEFLLRLFDRVKFNFSLLSNSVAEYRVRSWLKTSNIIHFQKNHVYWEESKVKIREMKSKWRPNLNLLEIERVIKERDQLAAIVEGKLVKMALYITRVNAVFRKLLRPIKRILEK